MSFKAGKFIAKHFLGQKLQIYTGDESDWFSYFDNDSMSYVLIVATVKDYDEESGVLTLVSETGHTFYMAETKIEMFWPDGSGFDIMKSTTSTIRSGTTQIKKSRDALNVKR